MARIKDGKVITKSMEKDTSEEMKKYPKLLDYLDDERDEWIWKEKFKWPKTKKYNLDQLEEIAKKISIEADKGTFHKAKDGREALEDFIQQNGFGVILEFLEEVLTDGKLNSQMF